MTSSNTGGGVRRAAIDDLPRIVGLESQCLGVDAWSEQGWREEFEAEPGTRHVVVAERGGGVVGYASLLIGPDVAEVLRVGVDPAVRRQGVGRMLLADLLDAARSAGAPAVMLEVRADNEPAVGLYGRAGFAEIARREGYYRDGVDARVMRQELESA